MKWITNLLLLIVVFILCTCSDEPIVQLNFFTVTTGEARPDVGALLGRTRLFGEVEMETGGVDPATIDSKGFYWSTDVNSLSEGNLAVVEILPAEDPEDLDMTAQSPIMEANVVYYYQAFAQSGDRLMKGVIQPTAFGTTTIINYLERRNDSIKLTASVLNLDGFITDFGIVLAKDDPQVTLETEGRVRLSGITDNTDQNTTITTTFGKVDFNTTYYARAYYVAESPTYGEVISIKINDGWIQLADTNFHLNGVAGYSNEQFGYAFGGYRLGAGISSTLYRFTPEQNNGTGSWGVLDDIGIPWYNGQFLSLSEQLVFGLGSSLNGQRFPWFTYTGSANQIVNFCNGTIPDTSHLAADGVAFSLNEKVYFGTGRYFWAGGGNSNKFWELSYSSDNSCYAIREIAPIPHIGTDMDTTWEGRIGAVTFEINNEHYVGGGVNLAGEFVDLHRFVPPEDENDPGGWELVGFLPGDRRSQATAFGLNGYGYYGFGFSLLSGSRKDFYRYDPDDGSWTPVEPFPGQPRSEAFSFVMIRDDFQQGFIGAGWQKLISPNGNQILPLYHNDFWTYIPIQ